MSYSLSFSPEFYFAAGEPYDRSDRAVNADGEPTSVWSAIEALREDAEAWAAMCGGCFPGVDPSMVGNESVLELIESTDTCSNLDSPVEVWIDPQGIHRVEVSDADESSDESPRPLRKACAISNTVRKAG